MCFRNWLESQMLCSVETDEISCHEMSFNPASWKQLLTVGHEDSVCLWNIEQSNQRYLVTPRYEDETNSSIHKQIHIIYSQGMKKLIHFNC